MINITNVTSNSFDEGMITGLIVNRINDQKTCPNKSFVQKKPINLKHYNFQLYDTELDNNAYYHISQLHVCYEKKTLKKLTPYEILLRIFIISTTVSIMFFSVICSTTKQRRFCCGVIIGIIIDNIIKSIFNEDSSD